MAEKRSHSQFTMDSYLSKLLNPIYYTPPATPTVIHIDDPLALFESPSDHVHRILSKASTVDFNLKGQCIQCEDALKNSIVLDSGNYSLLSSQVSQILNLSFQHELHNLPEDEYPFDLAFEFDNIHGRLPTCDVRSCLTLLDGILKLTEFAIYDLMPSCNQIVILDSTLTLEKAFEVLNFSNISAVPLWNNDKCYVYEIISPCNILYNFALQITNELNIQPYTFVKKLLSEIFPINPDPHLITITSNNNLYDACHILLDNGLLYAPVIDHFTKSISQILSLRDILSILYLKIVSLEESPTFLLSTLKQLEICINPNSEGLYSSDVVLEAFKLFGSDISIIPIISKEGLLINTLSKTDGIRILTEYPRLDLACISLQEVLCKETFRTNTSLFCSHDDSLIDVISQFNKTNTYWLITIDNYGYHTGLVNLSDILIFLFFKFREIA